MATSEELSGIMLYIHPPIAIVGHILIILASAFFILSYYRKKPMNKYVMPLAYLAWIFVFAGLVTGMLWAQWAWGAYWSWDPKETATLLLFITTTLFIFALERERHKYAAIFALLNIIMVPVTVSMTWIIVGMHSYLH